jgi:hypothetical protein
VKHRFRKSVKYVQTLPGAYTDSDRSLLVATICTRLKKWFLKNQDGMQRGCVLSDRKFWILSKKRLVQSNVKVGMWKSVEQYKTICVRYYE